MSGMYILLILINEINFFIYCFLHSNLIHVVDVCIMCACMQSYYMYTVCYTCSLNLFWFIVFQTSLMETSLLFMWVLVKETPSKPIDAQFLLFP